MYAQLQKRFKSHPWLFFFLVGVPLITSILSAISFEAANHPELLLLIGSCLSQAIPSCLIGFGCAYGLSRLADRVSFIDSLKSHPYLYGVFAGLPFVITGMLLLCTAFGVGISYTGSMLWAIVLTIFCLQAFTSVIGLALAYCLSFLLNRQVTVINDRLIRLYIASFAIAWTPAFLYLALLNLGLYLYDGPSDPFSPYWGFRLLQIIGIIWPMSALQALIAGIVFTAPVVVLAEIFKRLRKASVSSRSHSRSKGPA
jgi:hypothetical protein